MTMKHTYQESIRTHLQELCTRYLHRCTGSIGNIFAANYFLERCKELGYETSIQEFVCIDWRVGDLLLVSEDQEFRAHPSPWSLGVDAKAKLVVIESIEDLRDAVLQEKIVLLRGSITREQLMPKNFVFYNPAEHQEIIGLLEQKRPLAIITATEKNPELAGAIYPFPLFEDGDFNIPSVFMTAEEGLELQKKKGETVHLRFDAIRIPAQGFNALARKGVASAGKIVISAHIDTKPDTPGALDNATGVVIMLVMMELLKDYDGPLNLEFLAMNGEDYYAASGEMKYLAENEGQFSGMKLNINIDGAACKDAKAGFTLMGEDLKPFAEIGKNLKNNPAFLEMEPWYQGDHMIFIMNGVPALAITSDNLPYILTELAHTDKDTIEQVDEKMLEEIARALSDVIRSLK